MNLIDLKVTLKVKSYEFELALESGISNDKLLELYNELKELQYNILQEELSIFEREDNIEGIEIA